MRSFDDIKNSEGFWSWGRDFSKELVAMDSKSLAKSMRIDQTPMKNWPIIIIVISFWNSKKAYKDGIL